MDPHRKDRLRHASLVLAFALMAAVTFRLPAVPQDPAYHRMADERSLFGIPHAGDVLSSLAFAAAGLWGLVCVVRRTGLPDPWLAWPYGVLFAGTLLTSGGSVYYHLAPDNLRLLWDRLPMTLGFMGLLAAVFAERVSPQAGRVLFLPLAVLGPASVVSWYAGEVGGAGDLRPYGLVQFGSLVLVIAILLLYPARFRGTGYLWAGLAAYAAAKGFEVLDAAIYARLEVISGHTLKHFAAAAGVACVAAMLRARNRR
ncbi:MAG: alkaline phytoceramidase [Bryobacterales bacterium]|nr:alkaline phytoceramidase [Bryobacterales bacterium]